MVFAKRLKLYRTQKGLSISQTARLVGVSESTYRDWENGRQIKGEPYLKLATAFGVSLSQLFMGEEATPSGITADIRKIEDLLQRIRLKL